jgi:hypothetical protein
MPPTPLFPHFLIVVDAMLSFLQYLEIMRRIWLTLLVVFSLAVGGVASASAAQTCPFKSAPVAKHDCCPVDAMKKSPGSPHNSKKLTDCQLGQSCRGSFAVPVSVPILESVLIDGVNPAPVFADVRHISTVSFAFWRPPRIV